MLVEEVEMMEVVVVVVVDGGGSCGGSTSGGGSGRGFLNRGSCFVDHIGLELVATPLSQPPKSWDSRCRPLKIIPSCLANSIYFLF